MTKTSYFLLNSLHMCIKIVLHGLPQSITAEIPETKKSFEILRHDELLLIRLEQLPHVADTIVPVSEGVQYDLQVLPQVLLLVEVVVDVDVLGTNDDLHTTDR